MFKTIMNWIGLALMVLMALGKVTALQLLPFVFAVGMGFIQVYAKKDLRIPIIVVSALMILLNLILVLTKNVLALADVIFWVCYLVAFSKTDKKKSK